RSSCSKRRIASCRRIRRVCRRKPNDSSSAWASRCGSARGGGAAGVGGGGGAGVGGNPGEREERIAARTILWAAGVQASPLAAMLAHATGAATDRNGRLMVQPDLSLPGHPEIFAIGDMAHVEQDG